MILRRVAGAFLLTERNFRKIQDHGHLAEVRHGLADLSDFWVSRRDNYLCLQ
jgi:hypothetical protein